MASSSATRSASRSPSTMAASSRETCCTPPPRFRLWRRACSTRMRRINWAETAKKWARFCHCMRFIIHQAHVGFIDQGRGLQAVAGALAFHVAARQAVEFVINDRGQPFERALVSVAPGAEQRANVLRSRFTRLCRPLHRLSELYRRW